MEVIETQTQAQKVHVVEVSPTENAKILAQTAAQQSANSATSAANSATSATASANAADQSAQSAAESAAAAAIGAAVTAQRLATPRQINGVAFDGSADISLSATDAEAQAGTNTNKVITPKTLRSGLNAGGSAPVYACRAWVNFNGSGTVTIRASGNVSSITDNGVSDYTVNFATPMPDTNYVCAFGVSSIIQTNNQANASPGIISKTTSALRFSLASTSLDSTELNVIVVR